MTEKITLTNAGGTVNCDAIDWNESQSCTPFVGDVPTRSVGQYIDTGVWVLKTRRLQMRTRLSDAEKTTLLAIFNQLAVVTITAEAGTYKTWTYYGWFRDKDIVYEYSKETAVEPWRCDLIFDIYSFNYTACTCPSGEQVINGGFETGSFPPWTIEGTPNVASGGAHSGTYYARFSTSSTDRILQTFNNISVSCITTFELWAGGSGCVDPTLKVKVYYSDGSSETINFGTVCDWVKKDIKPHLDAGKCVSKIEIWFEWSGPAGGRIDDVTLIGSG